VAAVHEVLEPCLGDTGELSLQAYGGFAAEHRASAARSGADVSSRSNFPVLLTKRNAMFCTWIIERISLM